MKSGFSSRFTDRGPHFTFSIRFSLALFLINYVQMTTRTSPIINVA